MDGGGGLGLNMNALDYLILALYLVTVLGVGFAARRAIRTSVDFFLSGRSLPAWVTGLAFVSANLGALEIIGVALPGAARRDRRRPGRALLHPGLLIRPLIQGG